MTLGMFPRRDYDQFESVTWFSVYFENPKNRKDGMPHRVVVGFFFFGGVGLGGGCFFVLFFFKMA